MSNEKTEAEKKMGLFLNPSGPTGNSGFVVPDILKVGPGRPGPGDEWHVPPEPITDAGAASGTTPEVPASRTEKP